MSSFWEAWTRLIMALAFDLWRYPDALAHGEDDDEP